MLHASLTARKPDLMLICMSDAILCLESYVLVLILIMVGYIFSKIDGTQYKHCLIKLSMVCSVLGFK